MEFPINASYINDFMFCPYSILIHNMYEDIPKILYQSENQILGTYFHVEDELTFYVQKEDFIE